MMTGYQGGLYYYGTHHLQRENLNFGYLTEENWTSFNTVYASPMHAALPDNISMLLEKYYNEVGRNDNFNVVKYIRK